MTRSLTAGMAAAAVAETVRPFLAAELDFASGFSRANSTDRSLSFDTSAGVQTFLGVGALGRAGPAQEGTELQAHAMALTLSGVDPARLSIALGEHYQGRTAKIWMGFLDAGHAVIADPVLLFQGRMDDMPIVLGETGEVTVNIESRLADWERPRASRYTDAEQQRLFPGDKGLEFVAATVERELVWGRG